DRLVRSADVVLCTAPPLYEECAPLAKRCLVVPNGVYPEDFAAIGSPADVGRVVVGYYGAISELLDFDLLDAITELPGGRLELAGPIVAFDPTRSIERQTRTDALCARRNVGYHGVIDYQDLGAFMSDVHCAIVPFVLTADTHA